MNFPSESGFSPSAQEKCVVLEATKTPHDSYHAPEVYHGDSTPQVMNSKSIPTSDNHVYNGLEVYYDKAGLEPVRRVPAFNAYSTDAAVGQGHNHVGRELTASSPPKRRRLYWIFGILSFLALLAIGLGVGLHFGLNVRNPNVEDSAQSPTSPTTATNIPSTTSTASSNSLTSSISTGATQTSSLPSSTTFVITGSTGIASNDCRAITNNTYLTNNNPTLFNLDCGFDYPDGEGAYDGSGTVQDFPSRLITYTFEGCMEDCAIYNEQNPSGPLCGAITYNANLTSAVGGEHGNCFLKTVRGGLVAAGGPTENITASAYIASE